MARVRKATRPVQKASRKIKKAVPKAAKPKKRETPLSHIMLNLIAETLEHNALGGGEYHLPSVLTNQLDKNHPDYKLGLHLKYYIPITGKAPYYRIGEPLLIPLVRNQASVILPAFGEGIPIKKIDDPDLPLCKDCE